MIDKFYLTCRVILYRLTYKIRKTCRRPRPHEILSLKIKDIVFKAVDKYQYAEVLVNGKTGTRHIPLIQSIPYIKDWLSNHPSRNNPKCPLFVGLGRRRQLTVNGLYNIYTTLGRVLNRCWKHMVL